MKFADELTARVRVLRGEPRKTGTLVGEMHRAWIDLKAGSARLPAHEILAICEQAEDVATAAYREALKTPDVDELTLKLIQGQYEQVQLAHDRVRDLRDSPAYAYR
jgi:uncharacterized protein (TIGR02284 family)